MQRLLENLFEFAVSNRFFLSNRKMELSSGKLARFADGSAVVQVKKTPNDQNLCNFKISGSEQSLLGYHSIKRI